MVDFLCFSEKASFLSLDFLGGGLPGMNSEDFTLFSLHSLDW